MSGRKVKANGIDIWYEAFGNDSNPAVIFVAGAGDQATMWPEELLTPIVDAGFYAVIFDSRDVGYSSWIEDYDSSPYSIEDMAADTVGLMDALGIERAHIIGVSMGGCIAQLLAINYPNRVLSLTSWMSTYWFNDPDVSSMEDHVTESEEESAWLDSSLTQEQEIDLLVDAVKMLKGSRFPFREKELRDSLMRDMNRSYNPGCSHMLAFEKDVSRLDGLRELSIPAVVIHGNEDPAVSYLHGVVCAKVIPNATLYTQKGVGHEMPVGIMSETAALILKHLSSRAEIKSEKV